MLHLCAVLKLLPLARPKNQNRYPPPRAPSAHLTKFLQVLVTQDKSHRLKEAPTPKMTSRRTSSRITKISCYSRILRETPLPPVEVHQVLSELIKALTHCAWKNLTGLKMSSIPQEARFEEKTTRLKMNKYSYLNFLTGAINETRGVSTWSLSMWLQLDSHFLAYNKSPS